MTLNEKEFGENCDNVKLSETIEVAKSMLLGIEFVVKCLVRIGHKYEVFMDLDESSHILNRSELVKKLKEDQNRIDQEKTDALFFNSQLIQICEQNDEKNSMNFGVLKDFIERIDNWDTELKNTFIKLCEEKRFFEILKGLNSKSTKANEFNSHLYNFLGLSVIDNQNQIIELIDFVFKLTKPQINFLWGNERFLHLIEKNLVPNVLQTLGVKCSFDKEIRVSNLVKT